jgi:hypothetical protein
MLDIAFPVYLEPVLQPGIIQVIAAMETFEQDRVLVI